MKKVYGSYNNFIVGSLRDVLEQHGIRCLVRNEHLQGGGGAAAHRVLARAVGDGG